MKSKADRLKLKEEDQENDERGVIYIGHLPHGFVEDGLREYFS